MSTVREVMSWEQLGSGSRELAEAIYADDWIPDLILGISRGGLLVAGALAYALGVKNTATISVESSGVTAWAGQQLIARAGTARNRLLHHRTTHVGRT